MHHAKLSVEREPRTMSFLTARRSEKAFASNQLKSVSRFNVFFTYDTYYSAKVFHPVTGTNLSKDVSQANAGQPATASEFNTLDDVKKPENVTDAVCKEHLPKSQLTLNGIA